MLRPMRTLTLTRSCDRCQHDGPLVSQNASTPHHHLPPLEFGGHRLHRPRYHESSALLKPQQTLPLLPLSCSEPTAPLASRCPSRNIIPSLPLHALALPGELMDESARTRTLLIHAIPQSAIRRRTGTRQYLALWFPFLAVSIYERPAGTGREASASRTLLQWMLRCASG